MKTKTLFLSLFAGAFLCSSNASYAQYHSSGGGSGDGAWAQGTMAINVGVGFIGNGLGNVEGAGYTQSVSPAFELSFERGLNDHFGIGVGISYQSATATDTYTTQDFNYVTYQIENYSTTDKYTLSLLSFNVRGAYHFSAGAKFDPYIALALGYCTASATESETSTDPNAVSTSSGGGSITGLEYGVIGGARYFFTDHIGAWLELQYLAASFSVDGYSTTINASNVLNLGISFKF
jgi:hypothetical protein